MQSIEHDFHQVFLRKELLRKKHFLNPYWKDLWKELQVNQDLKGQNPFLKKMLQHLKLYKAREDL